MEIVRMGAVHALESVNKVAIKEFQKSYTYEHVFAYAKNFMAVMKDCYEKSREVSSMLSNLRIGIIAKPSVEFVAGIWSIWMSKAVAVPLAVSYPEEELLHVMKDADVSIVLGTEECRELLQKVAEKCSAKYFPLSMASSSPPNIENSEGKEQLPKSSESPCKQWLAETEKIMIARGDQPALFVYTSGTTGKPKGVVHTHDSISSQVDFMPKFSVRGVWQKICDSYPKEGVKTENRITVFTGVPTMYVRLLQGFDAMDHTNQELAAEAAHKLRLMMCGSSALPFPVMKRWENVTGHRLLERYGMTEFGMALSNPLHGTRKEGTVGRPLPGVQVKILGDNAHSSIEGELCVKSPSMFAGYWKNPEATKDSFGDDGFFRTGDTVKIDNDGYYSILGRTNVDILKVGGYKLSALEIEAVLLDHPKISECAVLGLPHEDYGEIVCAVLVVGEEDKKETASSSKPHISLQDIQSWTRDKLAPYKVPQKIYVWESLPRNAMGKVNKKELKQLLVTV
eukprot:TRINITY_DN5558_c0_g1_i2.p1 TRINITY_DN5558_c0_g1~~TRINITY_DN5558_c0_g1_i2.p1  ORF type:complete len:510 (+),score=116.96 TRINITY_DN5558_c0_g1_i2:399-1928(+)